ncbi:MAG: MoaD/ThiS family protein [Rhodothermales bacterium]|nr:MoaD/ThiS family protein [Rhodothermales bacterium]
MAAEDARVTVLLFSVLSDRVGQRVLNVSLPAGATGGSLLDTLAEEYPALAAYRAVIRLAVNAEYASEDVPLAAGDEVALITPVSGG